VSTPVGSKLVAGARYIEIDINLENILYLVCNHLGSKDVVGVRYIDIQMNCETNDM